MQRIVIIGCGFAGVWSALAAARLLDKHGVDTTSVEIVLIAPQPVLVMRPRLYEASAAKMTASVKELLDVVGVRYVSGTVETIHTDKNEVDVIDQTGSRSSLAYDSLVMASGSRLFRPEIPGLKEYAFSVDQLDEATELEAHCHSLAQFPDTDARNTVVVCGGGFTGIEIAAELPARFRSILGETTNVRVVIVEAAEDIGPELGPGPRPTIEQALTELGVERRLGCTVDAINAHGVDISTGERIEAKTVIWTAGMRASDLTKQISAERDKLGRLHVDRYLRVPTTTNVFATGDVAYAATDDKGNHALMSCQHALTLGRVSGNNAAAQILALPMVPYSQPVYVTGLDLGPWGAVHTEGWDRKVVLYGAASKARKQFVNSVYIYPPKADRTEAFAAADPERISVGTAKAATEHAKASRDRLAVP